MFKRNEKGIFEFPSTLIEGRAVRTGGYGGTRVRIAQGVSVNVGRTKAESHQELREIDSGELTLTNQRLVFTGALRTLAIPLNKIIDIEAQSLQRPAIAISREGIQKTQYFRIQGEGSIPIETEGRQYEVPFSSEMLVWLIEGAIEQNISNRK